MKTTPIAKALESYMLEHGVSQQELANRAGVSQSLLSRILAGQVTTPWLRTLAKLAKVISRQPEEFLRSSHEPSASDGSVSDEQQSRSGIREAIIADTVPLFAQGLAHLLRHDLGVQIVHTAEDLDCTLRVLRSTRSDIAVIDRDLLGGEAADALRVARDLSPSTSTVLTGVRLSDTDIGGAIRAHVSACILKTDTRDEIRKLIMRRDPARPAVSRSLEASFAQQMSPRTVPPLERLTKREIQMLTRIAQGSSLKEIATVMRVSPKTVDAHKKSVMAKLNIHDRVLLAHYAIREGLISVRSDA